MEWRDQGVLVSARRHGETSVIVRVFTAEHGLSAGVVRGGTSRKMAPVLQIGAQLDVTWRARLDEHLGSFTVEPVRSRAGVLSDRLALAGLNAMCGLLGFALPERESHAALYHESTVVMDLLLATPDWPLAYLQWEMTLLRELGHGLDLSCCAVTGATSDLVYVSPRSGRAVAAGAAGEWADRMLPLVPCMIGQGAADNAQIARALETTGYFLERRLARALGNTPVPGSRQRLLDALARS